MRFASLLVTGIMLGMTAPLVNAATDGPVILDVRTAPEYALGHLEGAVLIPHDRIADKIGTIVKNKSQKIYLYCRTGRRTNIAKNTLSTLGYTNIVDLGPMQNAAKALNRKIVPGDK